MKLRYLYFPVLLALLLLIPKGADAQSAQNLKGDLRAPDSSPVPGANVTLEGEALAQPLSSETDEEGAFEFSKVPPGNYVLTTKATDNGGASAVSDPVNISVQQGPPPPTNYPPVVRITSPPNGAVFHAPVDVPIYAYAHDPDDDVATVEFFADANSLGFGHRPTAGGGPSPTTLSTR